MALGSKIQSLEAGIAALHADRKTASAQTYTNMRLVEDQLSTLQAELDALKVEARPKFSLDTHGTMSSQNSLRDSSPQIGDSEQTIEQHIQASWALDEGDLAWEVRIWDDQKQTRGSVLRQPLLKMGRLPSSSTVDMSLEDS